MKKLIPHTHFWTGVLLSSLLASVALIGGLSIELVRRDILSFLPLLVALPAMNAMTGEYALLSAAHLGDPENYPKRTAKLFLALAISLPISCLGICALSLGIAHVRDFSITQELMVKYVKFVFITLYVVTFAIFAVIYLVKRMLLALGVNIDDMLIPVANTIASAILLIGFAIMTTKFV